MSGKRRRGGGLVPKTDLAAKDAPRRAAAAGADPAEAFEKLVAGLMRRATTPFTAGGGGPAGPVRTLAGLLPLVEAAGGAALAGGRGSAKQTAIQWLCNNNRGRKGGECLRWLAGGSGGGRSAEYTAAVDRLLTALTNPGCAAPELMARLAAARSPGAPRCPESEAGGAIDALLAEAWRKVVDARGEAGKAPAPTAAPDPAEWWTLDSLSQQARDELDRDPLHRDELFADLRAVCRLKAEGRLREAARLVRRAQRSWSANFTTPRRERGEPDIRFGPWPMRDRVAGEKAAGRARARPAAPQGRVSLDKAAMDDAAASLRRIARQLMLVQDAGVWFDRREAVAASLRVFVNEFNLKERGLSND